MKTIPQFVGQILYALVLLPVTSSAVSIDAVYFAQTHVQKPDFPYFGLVSNRDALIKVHVIDPAMPASPAVTATLTLNGQNLELPLTGPATLPASIPDGPGVVQHSFTNSFAAIMPADWVQPGLEIAVTADTATVQFNNLEIGAPTKVIMRMFDIQYFSDTNGDYPGGTLEELEAKWPVAELEVRRIPHVVFQELVIPPRADVPAARVTSRADYLEQTGLSFDGEQAAALAWNGALKRAGGRAGRRVLSYVNIYGVNAGGQAGGFAGVGNGTSQGILIHELGHALSLPHWGNSASYPYKGAMHGIPAPDNFNETHAGPTWGFDLRTQTFIPPTVQTNNVGGRTPGTYKVDPMQGGGNGYQEPGFLMNHFSDYSMNQMRNYLENHVVVWNEQLGSYARWNQGDAAYTTPVSNDGVDYPIERDVEVITVMASISGSNPDVNMVYPPIGPHTAGLIKLFDPTDPADRAEAQAIFSPGNGSDVSLRIIQGGVEKTYMLAASWEPTVDPLSGSSLKTEAINLRASDGEVTQVDLLLTPDAEVNGLPSDPQVLYTWVAPGPALVPLGATWRYLDDGTDQGTSWRTESFDDSGWSSGPAELGYGDGEATTISFGPNSSAKYPTYYFRHAFTATNIAGIAGLELRVQRDDGVVAYLNGTEILRDNMPEGEITYSTLALTAIGGGSETEFLSFDLPASLLNEGNNLLAVEIHQASLSSSDISFNAELRTERTLYDQDGDGLPSDWELLYGLDPLDPTDAAMDLDGDGLSNGAEFRLRTDPTDPSSGLRLTVDRAGNGIALSFETRAGVSYVLEGAREPAGPWLPANHIGTATTNGTINITRSIIWPNLYFRVRAD